MNIRSLFEIVKNYKEESRNKRPIIQHIQVPKKLTDKEKQDFDKIISTMDDEKKKTFRLFLHQVNVIIPQQLEFYPHDGELPLLEQLKSNDIVEKIKQFGLADAQCRTIDKISGKKILSMHYLFKDILQDADKRKLLHYLLVKYNNPNLISTLSLRESLIDQDVYDEYSILQQLKLTDEQIQSIEGITNIKLSKIKLKMKFSNIIMNDECKASFHTLLSKNNTSLKNVLFGDDILLLPHEDENEKINNHFVNFNEKYHYFLSDNKIKEVFRDVFFAVQLAINYLEKSITPKEQQIIYSEEDIANIAYKIMAIFSDTKNLSANKILENFEIYINTHNFQKMLISEILNFNIPENQTIKHSRLLLINENEPFPKTISVDEIILQEDQYGVLRAYWNENGEIKHGEQDMTVNDFSGILKKMKQHGNISNDPRLIHTISLIFKCTNDPLSSNILTEWRKIIRKNGEKLAKLFIEASIIEFYFKKEKIDYKSLSAESIYQILAKDRYGDQYEKDPELAMLFIKEDKSVMHFNFALELKARQKKKDNLPDLIIDCDDTTRDDRLVYPGYFFVKLPIHDKHAFLLGEITNCCQRLGGNSEQCIIDGITKENNGFYVLLKSLDNKKDKKPPLLANGDIDYNNYKIVGQGYAWLSSTGNLVFDSWENLKNEQEKNRVEQRWEMPLYDQIIVDVLSIFSKEVSSIYPSTQSVNIGTGGETPLYFRGNQYVYIMPAEQVWHNHVAYGKALRKALKRAPVLLLKDKFRTEDGNICPYTQEIQLCRLSHDESIEKIPIFSSRDKKIVDDNSKYLFISELPDEIVHAIKQHTNDYFRKEVPLATREPIIDSYQYGDSLTQATIGENLTITIDYADALLKIIPTIVGNIDDSNALGQCIKSALKEIPSVLVLKTIYSLLLDDINQLQVKVLFNYFNYLNPNVDKFIVKELFYAIHYLVYKKCFNNDSVNFLLTFLPKIENMKDDTKNHLINMAIIYSKMSNFNNFRDIIEIISKFDISIIKYIDRIFQSFEYALFISENNYKDSQMFSEKNIMLVLKFIDQCINKYRNMELIKSLSSGVMILYDAKLLTNEMLTFLINYLVKNCTYGDFINDKVVKLSDIFNELWNIETPHNKSIELLCIAVQNGGPIELIEFLINQKVEVDAISNLYEKSALSVGIETLITYYASGPFDTEFNNYINIISYLLVQYIKQGIIIDVKEADLIQYLSFTSIVNEFLSSQESSSKLLKFICKNNWIFLAESLLNISDYRKINQFLERHGQELHNWIVIKEHNHLIRLFSTLKKTDDLITNLEKNITHIWDNVDKSAFFHSCLKILRNAHDKNLLSNEFILFLHEYFLKIAQLTTDEFKVHIDKLSNIFRTLSSNDTNNPEGELLCLAAFYGHIELVKFLIAKEIDINFISSYGKSSLHLAIENKNLDVIIYLFEQLIKQDAVLSVEMQHILHNVPHDIRLQLREKVINNFLLTLEGCETLVRFICKNNDVILAEELIRMNPLVLHEVLKNNNHNFLTWLRNPQFTKLHTLFTVIKQADNIINQLRGNITDIQSPFDDNVIKELEKTCKAREGKIHRIKDVMKKLAKGSPNGTYLKLFIYSIASGLISKGYLPSLRETLIEEIQNSAKNNPDFINQLVREVLPNISISSVNILSDTSKIDLSHDQAASDKQKRLAAMVKQLEQGAEEYRTSENLMISKYEYGPLQKSDATKTLEFITRALMNDTAEIKIEYNNNNTVTVKIKTPETGEIELPKLMLSANFEHLVFESDDIQQFNEYIAKNITSWPFTSLELTDQIIKEKKIANELGHDLTNLEDGSLKAINLYTNDTISHHLNNLLEGHYDNQLNKDSIKYLLLIGMFALHGLNVPLPTLPNEKVVRKQAVTYRGISERDKNIFSNIIGLLSQIKSDNPMDRKIIVDIKKLVSTSVDPHVSISFGEDKNIKNIITFIHSSAKDISSISQHPEEKEMTFAGEKIVAELDQHNQNIIATVIRSPSAYTQLSIFSKKDSQIGIDNLYVKMIDSFNSRIDAYLSSQYKDLSHFKALNKLYGEMKAISPMSAEFIIFIHSEQKDDSDRPLTAQEKATKLFINFSEYEHEELEKIKDYPLLHTLINDFMKNMKVLIATPHQRFD